MTISQPNTKSRVTLSFTFAAPPPVEEWSQDQTSDLGLYRLRLLAERISLQEGFDELLCLDTLTGVETFCPAGFAHHLQLQYHSSTILPMLCREN